MLAMTSRVLGAVLLFAGLLAPLGAQEVAGPETAFDLRWNTSIPMRDGVDLVATLYVPRGATAESKAAAIFNMTPYATDGFHREAAALARRGFVFAAVDVRGRGNSEGTFQPWTNDGRDGHDVAEWLARQPWSSGKVGMMGHSYGGRAVWSTLAEEPPHLAAALPISASYPMWSWKNVQGPEAIQWILLTSGKTTNSKLLWDTRFWWEKYRELYVSGRPLRDFDRIVGFHSERFQEMLDHPTLDDYWDGPTPTDDAFRRIDIPVLTVTGAYDHNAPPLWYYEEHQRLASPDAADHALVIGPWGHHGALRPAPWLGGLTFGEDSLIDMTALIGDFFDHTLRGGPRPDLLDAPVRYWVRGAEEWRRAETLGEIESVRRSFVLGSGDGSATLDAPGRLTEGVEPSGSDGWIYDPLDLRPGLAAAQEVENYLTELDMPDDLYGAGVAYATAPFEAELDLVGRSRLSLWLSIDVPDTDVTSRLDLLLPDGSLVMLGEAWVRARFRNGLDREELVSTDEPFEVDLVFPFKSQRMPIGSRLRLVVHSQNSIYYGRHFNGPGPTADQSVDDARTARVRLLHDVDHPSRLEVPLRESGTVGQPPR